MEHPSPTTGDKWRKENESSAEFKSQKTLEQYFWRLSTSAFWLMFFYLTYLKSEEISNSRIFLKGVTRGRLTQIVRYSGWLLGRKMDKSDAQWTTFRENIPFLVVGSVVFLGISHFVKSTFRQVYSTLKRDNE